MKRCSRCGSEKSLSLFPKNASRPDGLNLWCKECSAIAARDYYRKNKSEVRARLKSEHQKARKASDDRLYRERHRDRLLEKKRSDYAANRERHLAGSRASYAENPDQAKARALQWKLNNRAKHNAGCMERHARKLCATPPWLNDDDRWMISEAYELAKLREVVTGGRWHVDHVVPLRSKLVCGLHVPWNLAVIPAWLNCSKRNRFEVK